MMSGDLLVGDTALITGAAGYIGAAIAQAIAAEGAQLFLTDIARRELQTVTDALVNVGTNTASLAADLSNPAECDRIVDVATKRFGRVSVLVHAASPPTVTSVLDLDPDIWNRMIAVNLYAGYRLASQLGKLMLRQSVKGRMLFITSLHAETPRGNPAYSAVKAGVTLMMREFAKELGPHSIRVNAIAPGLVAPNWFPNAQRTLDATPLRRLGKAREIAGMAVVLLADQYSSFVTGTTVTVDGGLSLHNWIDR